MTRTTVIMRPFPQRGLLTSAEEHEKAVAAWHEENELAEFETLLKSAEKLGVPIPDKELAALSPGLLAWLGWAVALAIARQYHPDFQPRGQAGRRVVWDDTRLYELVADVWYERDTTKGSDKAICAALADIDGPYSSRWGKRHARSSEPCRPVHRRQVLSSHQSSGLQSALQGGEPARGVHSAVRSLWRSIRSVSDPGIEGVNLRTKFIQLFAFMAAHFNSDPPFSVRFSSAGFSPD